FGLAEGPGAGRPRALLEGWVRDNPSVREMSHTPFLLTLLCAALERNHRLEGLTRAGLFEQMVRDLLARPAHGPRPGSDARAADLLPLLGEVAAASFRDRVEFGRSLPRARLRELIRQASQRLGSVTTADGLPCAGEPQRAARLLDELSQKRLFVPTDT